MIFQKEKIKKAFLVGLVSSLIIVPQTFAHVAVKPSEVGIGARTNFVVSVPTEEDVPTTQVRLVIPEGVQSVRPNVKPGWEIQLTKTGEGDESRISEIIWSGGSIPAEQKDEFVFSAQAPAEEGSLTWKAYQTYEGGDIVAWDSDPKEVEEYTKSNPPVDGQHDHNAPKPFSVTKIINDLTSEESVTTNTDTAIKGTNETNLPMILSVVAIVLSGGTLFLQMQRRK